MDKFLEGWKGEENTQLEAAGITGIAEIAATGILGSVLSRGTKGVKSILSKHKDIKPSIFKPGEFPKGGGGDGGLF